MVMLTVSESIETALEVQTDSIVTLQADDMYVVETNPYEGPYEWTPSEETQTIEVSGLISPMDITINPIPSNYGLITYDGSTITVS